MVLYLEARWRRAGESVGAPWDIEDPLTRGALKVVVVIEVSELVPARFVGEVDGDNPAFCDEGLDVAVHRRDADARDLLLSKLEDLLGVERSVRFLEDIANSVSLFCATWHRYLSLNGGVNCRRGHAHLHDRARMRDHHRVYERGADHRSRGVHRRERGRARDDDDHDHGCGDDRGCTHGRGGGDRDDHGHNRRHIRDDARVHVRGRGELRN